MFGEFLKRKILFKQNLQQHSEIHQTQIGIPER